MNPHFKGQSPFYEIWYGKLNIAPNEAFWFRYTLLNGKTKEAALWAIYFGPQKIIAQKKVFDLSQLGLTSCRVSLPLGFLSDTALEGSLPHIQWKLTYQNTHGGPTFDPVPSLFKRLHLTKTLVHTPLLDGVFSGDIVAEDQRRSFQNAPGMIGHVWGTRQALEWTWAHCNSFDQKEVLFEGLSARIPLLKWPSPPLTSLYLKYEGKEYIFNTALDLLKSHSSFGYTFWNFKAHSKEIMLSGKVKSLPQKIAVVTYTDTDDSHLYCHNSKLSDLELRVFEHKTQTQKIFKSQGTTALEWVTRQNFKGQKYL
ncbi:MAG: hypothetical protein HYW85_03625 [Deltaproteobacteria bacterium]|nr:hypothetical protein [Deltaproteobacteria bacterium]MBI3018152.1 hypothetical protein [Deltaproteobacteria bacterium]